MVKLQAIGIFCLSVFLVGCRNGMSVSNAKDIDTTQVFELDSLQAEHDISMDARQWADSIMDCMTVEEMAGQLIMPAVYSDDSYGTLQLLKKYATDSHVGGVVLLKGSIGDAKTVADSLRKMNPIPPFIAIDAEWGLAMRLEGTPEFPRNGRISENADETMLFDYGYEVARECREIGINMVLGPVLDVLPPGSRSSGIGTRSFGIDAQRAARLGVAYAKGVESAGVMSVAKHFPGHGSADADSHKRLPIVAKSREELESTDLLPFRDYVVNGLSGIMTGHLYVPSLDEDQEPVTVSKNILRGLLRDDMGFRGLIVTDAMNMAGAGGYSAADAIMAGADIVLAPSNTEDEVRILADAVRSGQFPIASLRDRVGRVLFHKYMVARVQDEYHGPVVSEEAERISNALASAPK